MTEAAAAAEVSVRYATQVGWSLVKKLGRIEGGAGKRITGVTRNASPRRRDRDRIDRCRIGWEYVHIAIDDCSRLAYAEVLPNEKATTAIAFSVALRRSLNDTA